MVGVNVFLWRNGSSGEPREWRCNNDSGNAVWKELSEGTFKE